MPDCTICGKPYKSRSGLATHRKTHHPFDRPVADRLPLAGMPGPVVRVPAQVEADLLASIDPTHNRYVDARLLDDACAALGIATSDILSFKVYPDRVVIVAGPTGKKLFWTREV